MNINFTITAHNFDKAAKIEAALKNIGISYCTRVDDKPSLGAGKTRRTRMMITKVEVLAVATRIADNPEWNDKDVSEACGVSRATVGRIRHGKHALQRDVEEIR